MLSDELNAYPDLDRIRRLLMTEIAGRIVQDAQHLHPHFAGQRLDLIFPIWHNHHHIANKLNYNMKGLIMLELDQHFTHDGQSIAWGSLGQGEPIILVHGFPWSAQAWRKIAPWLARTHEVFFFDMLGTGQSEKRAGQNVTESVQSDLLEALIGHWAIERPQVVGHDFGGLAALRGHFVNGVEYSKLHLINAVAVLPSGSPFYAHVANHEAAFSGLPDYAHEALFRAYIQNAAHYPLREESIQLYFDPWSGEEGKAAFYRQIAQANTANIDEAQRCYGKTDFNIHLIWGERDTFIPISQGKELQQLVDAKSFTPIPDAAHIGHEDAPEALLGALLKNICD